MQNNFIQGSSEWKAMRRKFIMASDAPVIMKVSPYKKTPNMLWREKLGMLNDEPDTPLLKFGRDNEEVARCLYEKITGNPMAPHVVFHKKINYMGSSLDGLSMDRDISVEIKCTSRVNHELAKAGKVPSGFLPQVYHQMECLGHDLLHYFSYHKGEGVLVEVKRDQDYIDQLLEEERKFWELLRNLQEPDLIDDDFIEMGESWKEQAQSLWNIEEKIRKDTAIAKEMKENLKAISNGKSCRSGSFKLVISSRKGSIDYAQIPILRDINLEEFRNPMTLSWSLKKAKEY